jgi:type VI secretion system protein ImpK
MSSTPYPPPGGFPQQPGAYPPPPGAYPPGTGAAPPSYAPRTVNLALVLQEVFTVTVRLRNNRQMVNDAEVFRNQIRSALKAAEREGKALGYTDEDIRLGIFAVVAFLDETVLNLRNPVFQDWVRRPMQEELFGQHVAGETFFQHLQKILGRRDTPETADLLEVYYLCLLLGFLGRYSVAGKGELRAIMGAIDDKMRRIRKTRPDLSPAWEIGGRAVNISSTDTWAQRLAFTAIGCAGLAVVLFIFYSILLGSGVSDLSTLAAQLPRF